jgi:hypothetical protein
MAALVVGHSPSVEETVELLTGSQDIIMPTCARVELSLLLPQTLNTIAIFLLNNGILTILQELLLHPE